MPAQSIDALTEPHARSLIFTAMRDASNYLLSDANFQLSNPPITHFDYSGDHDDYNPSAANLLAFLHNALADHHDALTIIRQLLDDADLIADAQTCDFHTPLFDYIPDYDD
jgi:hypothetical protein